MRRAGKIFAPLLLLMYVIASAAALLYVHVEYTQGASLHGSEVGAYQGAVLGARSRADAKTYYLRLAAEDAARRTVEEAKEDQAALFTTYEGDGAARLACGTYRNQLWNAEEWCVTMDAVLARLAPRITERVDERTLRYPDGAFTARYALTREDGEELTLRFQAVQRLDEPVLVGEYGSPADAARALTRTGVVDELGWPSDASRTVTSCFGPREGVAAAASTTHKGMDLSKEGWAIAAADGVVQNDPRTDRYATVWLTHTDTLSTAYLHLDPATIPANVAPGEAVTRGQRLGRPSNTGCADKGCGEHLHYAVLVRDPPPGAQHIYKSTLGDWYAVNPVCFHPDAVQDASTLDTTQSCDLQADWRTAYCDEYGFTVEPPSTTNPGTRIDTATGPDEAAEPALGPEPGRPTYEGLSMAQQENLQAMLLNRQRYAWSDAVTAAIAEHGVDEALVLGVITQESLGKPDAISYNGRSVGLMQLHESWRGTTSIPALRGREITPCGCSGAGGCACTPGNDARFDVPTNVDAGVFLLKDALRRYASYTDRVALALADYNAGGPAVERAIAAAGGGDARWSAVAEEFSPDAEVVSYVPSVLAYVAALNGGSALPAGPAPRVLRDSSLVGTYSWDPSLTVTAPGLGALEELLGWANATLAACGAAPEPGACLEDAAAAQGLRSCDSGAAAYLGDLYEALRDCSENGQDGCGCALPDAPPGVVGAMAFSQRHGTLDGDASFNGTYYERVTNRTIRLDDGTVVHSLHLVLVDGTLTAYYTTDASAELPAARVRKEDGHLVLTTQDAPTCAPVKTKYAYCSDEVRFAVTLQDDHPPAAPELTISNTTATITAQPDVSYHNLYAADGSRTHLYEGEFEITGYRRVTAVDHAGQEGPASTLPVT